MSSWLTSRPENSFFFHGLLFGTERGWSQAAHNHKDQDPDGSSDALESADVQRGVKANLGRDFRVLGLPFALKAGAEVRQSLRDIRGTSDPYTFVGQDKIRTTTPSALGSAGCFTTVT